MASLFKGRGLLRVVVLLLAVMVAPALFAQIKVPKKGKSTVETDVSETCHDVYVKPGRGVVKIHVGRKDSKDESEHDQNINIQIRIKYTKVVPGNPPTYEETETAWTGATGKSKDIDLPSDIKEETDTDGSKVYKIKVCIRTVHGTTAASNVATVTPDAKVKYNITGRKDNGAEVSSGAGVGGEVLMNPGELVAVTALDVAVLAGLSEPQDGTTDVFLVSLGGITTGNLHFIPSGGARFTGTELSVSAFDIEGEPISSELISFGTPSITSRGWIRVPVTEADAATSALIVVRGSTVSLTYVHSNTNHIGYTVAGTAVPDISVAVTGIGSGSTIGSGWSTHSWPSGAFEFATVTITASEGQSWYWLPVELFGAPKLVTESPDPGYTNGVVIREAAAGTFQDGFVLLSPMDSLLFSEEGEEVRVEIFDAADGARLTSNFDWSVSWTSAGELKATITGFAEYSETQLVITIMSPLVSYDGPLAMGNLERVLVHGNCLGQPVLAPMPMLEGADPDNGTKTLSSTPYNTVGTPAIEPIPSN